MNAEEIIALVRAMDSREIERLLALMKAYEVEFRRRPHAAAGESTIWPAALESGGKLAALERREREAQSNLE
jgi:hypothetical protein